MPAPRDRGGYRFAIICAMPIERAAVEDVLDLDYLDSTDKRDIEAVKSYGKEAWDTNAYIYGELAGKPIVLVTSPDTGTLNVTLAATSMRQSFPNIAVALVVGITGGCPFTVARGQRDHLEQTGIRLGDVVISKSMLEYDSGKQYENDFETNTEHHRRLPKAAALVRSYIMSIEGESRAFDRLFKATNIDMTQHPRLQAAKYNFPGRESDHIYPVNVQHRCSGSCLFCDKEEGICPTASGSTCEQLGCLPGQYPEGQKRDESKIFIGPYVAGSGVMKSAKRRQQLVEKHDALAIEMEGAGVWAIFPTIVVKAVVDYADSHKNKIWRDYPAARAALCAKGIVEALDPPPLPAITSVSVNAAPQASSSASKEPGISVGDLHRWLEPPDVSKDHYDAQKKRTPGTGKWLLSVETYRRWLVGPPKVLWLHGKVGSSKTVLCSTIFEDIRAHVESKLDVQAHLAYFYFSFHDSARQSIQSLLLSIISQLIIADNIPLVLISAYENNQKNSATLQEVLIAILSSSEVAYLVVDALDECPEEHCNREEIMSGLRKLRDACPHLRVLISSRREPDISIFMQRWSSSILELEARSVDADISIYVDAELQRHATLAQLHPDVKYQIRQTLTSKSDGMFRWVYCQMEQLRLLKFPTGNSVTKTLQDLPKTLDETYERILQNFDHVNEVKIALRWLAFREGSLTMRALREACLTNHDTKPYVDEASRRLVDSLLESMSSLIQIQGREVMLGHQSVKEYLVSERIKTSPAAAFYLSEPQSLYLIAQDCVAYLLHCLDAFQVVYEVERKRALERGIDSFFWPVDVATPATELVSQPIDVPMGVPWAFSARYPLLAQACSWIHYRRAAESLLATIPGQGLHQVLLARTSGIRFWLALSSDSSLRGYLVVTNLANLSPDNSGLIIAASIGLVRTVQAMLDVTKGGSIRTQTIGLALAEAACCGHHEIVELLLGVGADPNQVVKDVGHKTLFNLTSCLTESATASSASSTPAHGLHSSPVLVCACHRGHVKVVEALLSDGADPNLSDDEEGTALQIACDFGDVAIVELLLRFGAEPDRYTGFRNAALNIACGDGFQERTWRMSGQRDQRVSVSTLTSSARRFELQQRIARLLLGAGANPNLPGADGERPLELACANWSSEIICILLNAKASPIVAFGQTNLLLQVACIKRDQMVLRRLLELGMNPSGNSEAGYTMELGKFSALWKDVVHNMAPLQIACDRWSNNPTVDHPAMIRLLLAHGADPNAIDTAYASPLQSVGRLMAFPESLTLHDLRQNVASVTEALLHSGANPNLLPGAQPSALQSACEAADEGMVQRLLAAGADINAAMRHSQMHNMSRLTYFGSKAIIRMYLRRSHSFDNVIAGDVLWAAVHLGPTDNLALLLTGSHGSRIFPDALSTRKYTALYSILDWPAKSKFPSDGLWDIWTWKRVEGEETPSSEVVNICNEMLARVRLLLSAGADVTALRSGSRIPGTSFLRATETFGAGSREKAQIMLAYAGRLAWLLADHGARELYYGCPQLKSVPEHVLLRGRLYIVETDSGGYPCHSWLGSETHTRPVYYVQVTNSEGQLLGSPTNPQVSPTHEFAEKLSDGSTSETEFTLDFWKHGEPKEAQRTRTPRESQRPRYPPSTTLTRRSYLERATEPVRQPSGSQAEHQAQAQKQEPKQKEKEEQKENNKAAKPKSKAQRTLTCMLQ